MHENLCREKVVILNRVRKFDACDQFISLFEEQKYSCRRIQYFLEAKLH